MHVWKTPHLSSMATRDPQTASIPSPRSNSVWYRSIEDGFVALWGLSKKQPLTLKCEVHGLQREPGMEQPYSA